MIFSLNKFDSYYNNNTKKIIEDRKKVDKTVLALHSKLRES